MKFEIIVGEGSGAVQRRVEADDLPMALAFAADTARSCGATRAWLSGPGAGRWVYTSEVPALDAPPADTPKTEADQARACAAALDAAGLPFPGSLARWP